MTISEQLKNTPAEDKDIGGQRQFDPKRFSYDTGYMIIYDDLQSPDEGRFRAFLTYAEYAQAREAAANGQIRIIRRAVICKGQAFYGPPEQGLDII